MNGTLVSRRLARLVMLASAALLTGCPPAAPPQQVAPTFNPDWAEMTIRTTGRGAYPENVAAAQARLMAERAARVDALRKLTEQIYGLEVRSGTTVRDAVLANDVIRTNFEGFIRGARIVETRRRPEIGLVEMIMEIHLGTEFQNIVFR